MQRFAMRLLLAHGRCDTHHPPPRALALMSKEDIYRSAFLVRVFALILSQTISLAISVTLTTAERMQNKNPVRDLLTFQKIVETDNPVPSYLVGISQNPEGVGRDTPSRSRCKWLSYVHTVYVVDHGIVPSFHIP